MKILLHTCCAPCVIIPYQEICKDGHLAVVYFYNPNIHPYREFRKRLCSLKDLCQQNSIEAIYDEDYGLEEYLAWVYNRGGKNRCEVCYEMRLRRTAEVAAQKGFDAFSTTLLSSPHQNREVICEVGNRMSRESGVQFKPYDWRSGHKQSLEIARGRGLYLQPYCGCIFSEEERYRPKKRREIRRKKIRQTPNNSISKIEDKS